MKRVVQKVARGRIDSFTLTFAPPHHSRHLRFCIWDALMLSVLLVGFVHLMRTLLAS